MTHELVINGTTYEFKFGMGFLRDIDSTHTIERNGITEKSGLFWSLAKLADEDLEELYKVLRIANKGFKPRLEQSEYDQWIDDEDTDIDQVFEEVMSFFEQSNSCRKQYLKVMKIKQELEEQEAQVSAE